MNIRQLMTRTVSLAAGVFTSIATVIFTTCSSLSPVAGTGSQAGNGMVLGKLVDSTGAPVSNAQVKLVPAEYDIMADGTLPSTSRTTTDNEGQFVFPTVDSGRYNIQTFTLSKGTVSLSTGIVVYGDTVTAPAATVRAPGALRVMLPAEGIDYTNGYLYIPGTTIAAFIADNVGFVEMSAVPAADNLTIKYGVLKKQQRMVIRYGVTVEPGKTTVVAMPSWAYARRLVLNTSATGTDVAGTVTNFPVLVRLSSANFNFAEAKSGGEDLRFSKPDGSLLSYEIEQWDASQALAAVWVRVDTVRGNDSTQFIVMLWGASTPFDTAQGNSSATPLSNNAAVFDTAAGFQGVWHLNEAGNTTAFDATANGYSGTPRNMSAASGVAGLIGNARQFDDATTYIEMLNTASSRLNFSIGSSFTLSAWGYLDKDSNNSVLVGKGDWQYNLDCNYRFKWHMSGHGPGMWCEAEDSIHPVSRAWQFIVGVCNGTGMTLYVNGVLANNRPIDYGQQHVWDTVFNVEIGKIADSVSRVWAGKIDEVRISDISRSADWIKLEYMNQRADDALVKFR